MYIKGSQLIPATVTSNKGDVYEDLYFINIYNIIEAMDKDQEKSKFNVNDYEMIYWINCFNLDREVLRKIPLEERLIFKLNENKVIKLIHKSVVDAIMAVHTEGVQFTKVEDWVF